MRVEVYSMLVICGKVSSAGLYSVVARKSRHINLYKHGKVYPRTEEVRGRVVYNVGEVLGGHARMPRDVCTRCS